MAMSACKMGIGLSIAAASILFVGEARADDAIVTIGQRFAEPPREPADGPLLAEDQGRFADPPRENRRSPFRLTLGPAGVTTGRGFGVGVGVGADFGTGSVGGRLSATWLRGEGTRADGTSTPTGDAIGQYTGELTLDLHKRGPLHPIVGTGIGLVHVSRPDTSGYAGVGTGRVGLEYALGLDDADVRVGASVTGGLIGPVDSDVKDLRAYAISGLHVAIGF